MSEGQSLFVSAIEMAEADNYNDWTFDLFAPYLHGQVLEVGCGVGSFTRRIVARSKFDSLLSIDISAEAVAHTRQHTQHPALNLRHQDVREISGKFDAIICMNVLEHIKEDAATLRHMIELLSPRGTLFLLVPAHQFLYSSFDHAVGHYRRYNKRELRELLAGLNNHVTYTDFYFNIIGALGYWFVYHVLRKSPNTNATSSEIGAFDKYVVPVMRRFEGKHLPFGLSLITVITREQA